MPDRATLQAYLEGRLTAAETHDVERHMEEDPLLREAIEGLGMPGATSILGTLEQHRPTGKSSLGAGPLWIAGTILFMVFLAGSWLVVSPLLEGSAKASERSAHAVQQSIADVELVYLPLDAQVIAIAEEQPETLRIGHSADDRPLISELSAQPVARDPGIETMQGVAPLTPVTGDDERTTPVRAKRPSRKLLFPHDLKLVHPDELYPYEPTIDPGELSVSAQYPDRKTQDANAQVQRTMRYTDFMDMTLGNFAANDHKACLEDLRFLMEQYPDDVNALFYAGLCSYNLALYTHARSFLHRAATHSIDSFQEEAVWYHALTLDRLGETESAQEAYARIVAENGFYAERARARLRTP